MIAFDFDEDGEIISVSVPEVSSGKRHHRCDSYHCDEADFIDRGDYWQHVCGITNMGIGDSCPRFLWYSGNHPRLLKVAHNFTDEE